MCLTRRVLIYTAFGNEKYFQIAGKLSAAGVCFKTRSRSNHRFTVGHNQLMPRTDFDSQYDIYVTKEDKHKACQAIYKNE